MCFRKKKLKMLPTTSGSVTTDYDAMENNLAKEEEGDEMG